MNKLTRISATVASSIALVAGFTGLAGAATIDTTGPGSNNEIEREHKVRTFVKNDNYVKVWNDNSQKAESGEAEAERNTTVGDVSSGDAENENWTDASVSVSNSSATSGATSMGSGLGDDDWGDATISTTGPGSNNEIEYETSVRTTVKNENTVKIYNDNYQRAESGEAEAERNTTVGDVSSGDASNYNDSTFEVTVSN